MDALQESIACCIHQQQQTLGIPGLMELLGVYPTKQGTVLNIRVNEEARNTLAALCEPDKIQIGPG